MESEIHVVFNLSPDGSSYLSQWHTGWNIEGMSVLLL